MDEEKTNNQQENENKPIAYDEDYYMHDFSGLLEER